MDRDHQYYFTAADAKNRWHKKHKKSNPVSLKSSQGSFSRYHPTYGQITLFAPPNPSPAVIQASTTRSNAGPSKRRRVNQAPIPSSNTSFGLHTPPTTPQKIRPTSKSTRSPNSTVPSQSPIGDTTPSQTIQPTDEVFF
jgi:hypothetical protein